jgi:hypothetical protein
MMTSTDYGALLPRQCAKYKACEDFSVAEWDEVEENAALRRAPATRTRHLAWFTDNRRLNPTENNNSAPLGMPLSRESEERDKNGKEINRSN